MSSEFNNSDFSNLKSGTESSESGNMNNTPFDAYKHLSSEGKEFLEKIGGQMRTDLPKIQELVFKGTENGWLTPEEVQEIVEQLKQAKNALDTFKILQKVQSKDPILKTPDKVDLQIEEKETIEENLGKLANLLKRPFSTTSNGSLYVTNDKRQSIFYVNLENNKISTALTRQELTRILLSTGDMDLYHYFSDLMKLPPATTEDFRYAKKNKEIRQKDR